MIEPVGQRRPGESSGLDWNDVTDRQPVNQGELCEGCSSIMLNQPGTYITHHIGGISNSCPSCRFIARNFHELGFIKDLPLQLSQITFLGTPSLVLSDEQKCCVLQGLDGQLRSRPLKMKAHACAVDRH